MGNLTETSTTDLCKNKGLPLESRTTPNGEIPIGIISEESSEYVCSLCKSPCRFYDSQQP